MFVDCYHMITFATLAPLQIVIRYFYPTASWFSGLYYVSLWADTDLPPTALGGNRTHNLKRRRQNYYQLYWAARPDSQCIRIMWSSTSNVDCFDFLDNLSYWNIVLRSLKRLLSLVSHIQSELFMYKYVRALFAGLMNYSLQFKNSGTIKIILLYVEGTPPYWHAPSGFG